MSIKLEVGKTYKTRDGRHYKIYQEYGTLYGGHFPFIGVCTYVPQENHRGCLGEIDDFKMNGRYYSYGKESRYDLLEEVTDSQNSTADSASVTSDTHVDHACKVLTDEELLLAASEWVAYRSIQGENHLV